jgi:hypothetical protein
MILLALALAAGDPAWTFAPGSTLKMEVEYEKCYRIKGGAPEMEGQDVYKDQLKATLALKALEVAADGTTVFELKVSRIRVGLGGDSGPPSSIFDSGDRAGNKRPVEWAALFPELVFKIAVDRSGKIVKEEGFEVDAYLPAARLALLGRHLFALPAPPAAGGTSKASLTILHDLESAGERFNLKDDTTSHDLPVTLTSKAAGAALEVAGTVDPGTQADLGKKGREFWTPGVAFTGELRGVWKDGWTETSWATKGAAQVKLEKKRVDFEIHTRYAAKRLP